MSVDLSINIFVNNDLKMGKGKIVGQACHAVHYITKEIINNKNTNEFKEIYQRYVAWQKSGYNINIFYKSSDDLLLLSNITESVTVIDAGRTQIAPNSMTVVGFYPNSITNILTNLENNKIKQYRDNQNDTIDFGNDSEQLAMYIFINTDLKLSTNELVQEAGKITSFVIRSLEQMKTECVETPDIYKKYKRWDKFGCAKIILKANTQQLEQLKLIPLSLFTSAEQTNIITTVAFYPNIKSQIADITGGYKLL